MQANIITSIRILCGIAIATFAAVQEGHFIRTKKIIE